MSLCLKLTKYAEDERQKPLFLRKFFENALVVVNRQRGLHIGLLSNPKTAHCNQTVICYNPFAMNTITPIDITNIPALRRIIADMKNAKQPRLLKQDSETVAMLLPIGTVLEQPIQDIWKGYRSDKVKQALKQSAGMLTRVNRKELLAEITNARSQETHRRSF